jgi:hypothetical protein
MLATAAGEVVMDEAQVSVRALGTSDGRAAVTVINTAAEWYAEFLATSELHGPEMTLKGWEEEARRMTWYGAFEGADLVGVMGLEYAGSAVLFRMPTCCPTVRARYRIDAPRPSRRRDPWCRQEASSAAIQSPAKSSGANSAGVGEIAMLVLNIAQLRVIVPSQVPTLSPFRSASSNQ